jgi:hypothetical protein
MAKWGNCDIAQLKQFQTKMNKLKPSDIDAFIEECAKELATRLLAKVIKRTPVGQYQGGSGKIGGTLRRGWTAKTEAEAQSGSGSSAKQYVQSLTVNKVGDVYEIEIVNPVHYSPYVEYGHRTRNHKGWVKGKFMLTISEQELDAQSPKILENKLVKYLGGII